jgi:ELWxxDGT repeat protein
VASGLELYATDGTTVQLVKDILYGPGSSNLYNLVNGDTTIYFTADDGKHGMEIWKSNGTKEGTSLVKNITPGTGSTYPNNMTTVHNELFFILDNILWQSDGTSKGTYIVNDANLAGVTGLSNFTAFDNKLAFTAFESSTGYELYIGDAGSETFAINNASDAPVIKTNIPSFGVRVYPNPASTKAVLEFTGDIKKVAVIITDVSGRIIWQSNFYNQQSINLPVEKLKAGTYLITAKINNESKTIKLVKQ